MSIKSFHLVPPDQYDRMFPEWKIQAEFLNFHLNTALKLDAKLSSHPVEVDCPDANKIMQIFDAMSYSKAASGMRINLSPVKRFC